MKRKMRKLQRLCAVLLVVVFMTHSIMLPLSASQRASSYNETDQTRSVSVVEAMARDMLSQNSTLGSEYAVLTSAINREPFVVFYNPDTGRVEQYDMHGNNIGFRYVENEAAFHELVSFNTNLMSLSDNDISALFESYMNRNLTIIDSTHQVLVEYDALGSRITRPIPEEYAHLMLGQSIVGNVYGLENSIIGNIEGNVAEVAPLFTGVTWTWVPFSPSFNFWAMNIVGGRYFTTNWWDTHVGLQLFNFPHGMTFVDVMISNWVGDCWSAGGGFFANMHLLHPLRFPGEPYAARISSRNGSFSNVPMNFSTAQQQQTTFVRFVDSNSGSEFRASQNRVPNFNGFTNVYVGKSSYFNNSMVSTAISWDRIHWHSTGTQHGWGNFPSNTVSNPFQHPVLANYFIWHDMSRMGLSTSLNDNQANQLLWFIDGMLSQSGWWLGVFSSNYTEDSFHYLHEMILNDEIEGFALYDFMYWCEDAEMYLFDAFSAALAIPWNDVTVLSGAAATLSASITALKVTAGTAAGTFWIPGWGQGAKIAAAAAAAGVAVLAAVYTSNSVSATNWANSVIASGGVNWNSTWGHSVYVLRSTASASNPNRIFYVGRTNDVWRRNSEHYVNTNTSFVPFTRFTMIVVATGLTLNEARLLEQALIVGYSTLTVGNKVNSINPRRFDINRWRRETEVLNALFRIVN